MLKELAEMKFADLHSIKRDLEPVQPRLLVDNQNKYLLLPGDKDFDARPGSQLNRLRIEREKDTISKIEWIKTDSLGAKL